MEADTEAEDARCHVTSRDEPTTTVSGSQFLAAARSKATYHPCAQQLDVFTKIPSCASQLEFSRKAMDCCTSAKTRLRMRMKHWLACLPRMFQRTRRHVRRNCKETQATKEMKPRVVVAVRPWRRSRGSGDSESEPASDDTSVHAELFAMVSLMLGLEAKHGSRCYDRRRFEKGQGLLLLLLRSADMTQPYLRLGRSELSLCL